MANVYLKCEKKYVSMNRRAVNTCKLNCKPKEPVDAMIHANKCLSRCAIAAALLKNC